MRVLPALVLSLVACNGDGGDDGATTPQPGGCDSVVTSPLSQVPTDQWPEGVPEAIDTYLSVPGRWETENSCGGTTGVKITIASEEDLEVVLEPWNTVSACGCATDPNFEADSTYDVVALHENFQFFLETFDDPGANARTVPGSGALFAPGEPLKFRGCGTQNIDPVTGSDFDLVTTIMRVTGTGGLNGTVVLTDEDGEVEQRVCELTNWTFVE